MKLYGLFKNPMSFLLLFLLHLLSLITQILISFKVNSYFQFQPSTLTLLQADSSTLTSYQWNMLSNLVHCFDEHSGISLAKSYTVQQACLPVKTRYKCESVGELFASFMAGSQLLFEKNLDFLSLNFDDRSLLLYGKLKYIAGISACFLLYHTGLLDNPAFYATTEALFGVEAMLLGKFTTDLIDPDVVFVKLGLSILIFSTLDYIFYSNAGPTNLKNNLIVFHVQSIYTEIAWRYMVYKYGHSRAVVSFSNLIRCIFSANKSIIRATERKNYTDMLDVVIKQTEETLSLNN